MTNGTLWWEMSGVLTLLDIRNFLKQFAVNTIINTKQLTDGFIMEVLMEVFTLPDRALINDGIYYFKMKSQSSLTIIGL
jgi:hypothetical protein